MAIIESFEGGQSMRRRLEGMGIRPGKAIFRVSTQFNRGPVIVSVDGHQTAIGHGLAEKIIVRQPEFNGTGISHEKVIDPVSESSKNGEQKTDYYDMAVPQKEIVEAKPTQSSQNLQ